MRRINLGGLSSSPLRISTTYFQPSFASSSCAAALSASTQTTVKSSACSAATRRRSFSSSANGSSSRAGSGSGARSPTTSATKPGNGGTSASNGARSSSPSGARIATAPVTQKQQQQQQQPAIVTPLAPPLPHATAGLVRLDSFFAVHRPLLELPIRLHQRKTTSVKSSLSSAQINSSVELQHEGATVAEQQSSEAETAEVVELDENGNSVGTSFRVMLGATQAMEPLKSAEEERELEAQQELELAEEHEAIMEELEQDHADPYDAWLLGEPEGLPHAPVVARYLASHPPFSTPSAPQPTKQSACSASSDSATTSMTPQALADLSYLRPHARSPTAETERSSYSSVFAGQIVNPLDPNSAKQQVDRFLSAASLTHRWHAQRDYDHYVTERMQSAEQQYNGLESTPENSKERGTVRLWSEKDGWVNINIKQRDAGLATNSPFLAAELVDLAWVDEDGADIKTLGDIALDSTKRKRKKKMTKHKYKKRRKAQRALRQRLGK
ncbi:hypothetical protein OIO90_000404 [Microbotryomycetes sp. JL221]|nr:hypothetical protein OIO90_000404 [Microbotryomycetes sp. JL221]